MGLQDRYEVAISFPFILRNSGYSSHLVDLDMEAFGLGDILLSGKAFLFNQCELPVDLGASATLAIPSGKPKALFGSPAGRIHLRMAAARLFSTRELAPIYSFLATGNMGMLFRAKDAEIVGIGYSHELTFDLSVMALISQQDIEAGIVFLGSTPLLSPFSAGSASQLEADFAVRFPIGAGLYLGASAGSGLVSGYETPDLRLLVRLGYRSPAAGSDNDSDGVYDKFDSCPCNRNFP